VGKPTLNLRFKMEGIYGGDEGSEEGRERGKEGKGGTRVRVDWRGSLSRIRPKVRIRWIAFALFCETPIVDSGNSQHILFQIFQIDARLLSADCPSLTHDATVEGI